MKRGGPTHPKTFNLAELLGIRRAHAVGILELLFHFTAQYAPEGDVGRYSDKRIAAAVDWHGSPVKLVSALVEARWLDPHPTARLAVHDWAEHADRTTLQKLRHNGKMPVESNHVDTTKVCTKPEAPGITLGTLPEPEPVPEPVPVPGPEPEPVAARALRAPPAAVRPIRQERSIPGGISDSTWDDFRNLYAESAKPTNETDWRRAAQEAVTLNLSESDMTEQVIPGLAAELPGWAEREIGMVPFPAGFLKSQPWTRKAAKSREPPLTREQRRQREIDAEWGRLGNGTSEG